MSSSSSRFIALAVAGRISPAEIDDFIDRWHEECSDSQLHDYLGLTRAEYALWLVEPDMLDAIVKARAEERSLPALVSEMIAYRGSSGASDGAARSEHLVSWLAEHATRDRA